MCVDDHWKRQKKGIHQYRHYRLWEHLYSMNYLSEEAFMTYRAHLLWNDHPSLCVPVQNEPTSKDTIPMLTVPTRQLGIVTVTLPTEIQKEA